MRLATLVLAALLAVAGCSAQRSNPHPHPHPHPGLNYGACSLLEGTSRAAHALERCTTRR